MVTWIFFLITVMPKYSMAEEEAYEDGPQELPGFIPGGTGVHNEQSGILAVKKMVVTFLLHLHVPQIIVLFFFPIVF